MTMKTADLCDQFASELRVAEPGLVSFGARKRFGGEIATVRVFEDNALVRKVLTEEPGRGRVLVVDGQGAKRCALAGDCLATLAAKNGWAGLIVNGCVRDSEELAAVDIGIVALGLSPRRSGKTGQGERGLPAWFAGLCFREGEFVYADPDGVVVARADLEKRQPST